eukprot:TCONS_00021710-protein
MSGMDFFSRSNAAKPTAMQCTWRTYGCLKEFNNQDDKIVHEATCQVTNISYAKVKETNKIVDLRDKAKEIYKLRIPGVEARRDKLAEIHSNLTEELRIEVDKKQENEQRLGIVTTDTGERKVVYFKDLVTLIQQDDLETFVQYTATAENLFKLVDGSGDTLLHHAAQKKRPEIAFWLIQNGLEPSTKDHNGFNIAQIAVSIDTLPILKVALDTDSSLTNIQDGNGATLLHWALELDHVEIAKYLLSRVDLDVDLKNNSDKKPDEIDGLNKEMKKLIKNHR